MGKGEARQIEGLEYSFDWLAVTVHRFLMYLIQITVSWHSKPKEQ